LCRYVAGHTNSVRCIVDFHGTLCSGGKDDKVLMWDVERALAAELAGHAGGVVCAAVSGGRIITGSYDRTVKVWDAESRQCMYNMVGHAEPVWSVGVCGGGQMFTVGRCTLNQVDP
jgi:F-box/WD-40 domain protein 7